MNHAIPKFKYPWPGARANTVEHLEQEMLGWAQDHKLILNSEHLERVKRTKYSWLAARCYPRAHPTLLRVIADYFIWYFLVDDLFVDRVEVLRPSTLKNLTAMIDVLDFNTVSADPVYGEVAWLDICRRLKTHVSEEHFQRFANGMRMWASTAGLQIINHKSNASVEIKQYETIRRHTSGMNPCIDLADAANNGMLPAMEFFSEPVQKLRQYANNAVCWSNDIQSHDIEQQQPGQFLNRVSIYAKQGHSVQESINYTAKDVRREIAKFVKLAKSLEPQASNELQGFIAGMQNWMRGYQDWVELDTQRYSNSFAKQDADDRNLMKE